MKRLLINARGPSEAVSFWRAYGPFLALRHPDWQIEFNRAGMMDWTIIAEFDALYFQRPHLKEDLDAIMVANALGRKVWIDFDDDLFSVPKFNPTAALYHNEIIQKYVRQCLALADVITVSTKLLERRLAKETGRPIVTVPNAWNDNLLPLQKSGQVSKRKRVFWRGSSTHHQDVESQLAGLSAIHRRNPDWQWVFIGAPPSYRIDQALSGAKIFEHPFIGLLPYIRSLQTIDASIMLVPLEDCAFNRCKSNIAWQEGTFAGAAVVCPDFEEWRIDGTVRYGEGPHAIADAFDEAVSKSAELVKKSRETIAESYLLSKVNRLRVEILDGLLARPKEGDHVSIDRDEKERTGDSRRDDGGHPPLALRLERPGRIAARL